MDKHTIKCDIETERNQEQVNNINPIVPPTPNKNKGHLQWSCQFCYGEKFLWLGVPQQTARLQKSIFPQYAIEIKTSKTKGSNLVPYSGWLK